MTIVAVNGAGNIPHENVMDGTSNTTDPINIVMGDGSVRFVSHTTSPPEIILPYIEQRGAEPGDGGDWISDPDTIYRDAGGDGVGLLDGGFVIDWTPAAASTIVGHTTISNPSWGGIQDTGGGDELMAGFCATGQPSADGSGHNAFPTETIKMTYGAIEWSYTKDTGGGSEGDGSFVIDCTATDSSSRGSPIEVNHSEFSIVKLCDAATPKAPEPDGVLDYNGGDGRTSGPIDDLIGWDFRPGDSQADCSLFLCGDNGPPAQSQTMHVAISLGDGSTVEAMSLWPQDLLLL